MKHRNTLIAISLVLLLAAMAVAARMKTFDHSEPLGDVTVAEVQLDLSLAETHLMVGKEDQLIAFNGSYDDSHMKEPTLKVERSGEDAYIYLESESDGDFFGDRHDDKEGGEFEITLSPVPEYSLKAEVGLGENNFDLTGLKVKRLDIEAGLAEMNLRMDEPNGITADRVVLECGLGELDTDQIGNLRFERLNVDVGMGDMTLDLTGYEGKGRVEVSVGMGSCDIIVPKNVGLIVYHEGGFMSSVDLDDLEKVRDDVWQSENFDTAESTLEMDLSVGMGDIDVRHR